MVPYSSTQVTQHDLAHLNSTLLGRVLQLKKENPSLRNEKEVENNTFSTSGASVNVSMSPNTSYPVEISSDRIHSEMMRCCL